ncbi:MAG: SPFH domain-containing protein [Clostridia bacterium]|nr:SPFH domain-containing protein [Clostridia bacterium]
MALFRLNVVWNDDSKNTLVYKYPLKNYGREINNKSTLTVKESQCAIFVHKGQIADVFGPGLYDLGTDIFPILSKLAGWKYGFQTPITCDIYYINTKQFTNIQWGTKNPIMMSDSRFGMVRVRAFGTFSYKVDDPAVFLKELFGTNSTFVTDDINDFLKSMLLSCFADSLGESKVSALDLAANTLEFNEIVKGSVQNKFNELGLKLVNLFIENMSLPEEVTKAMDERTKLGILGDSTDTLMKVSAAEAMKTAAANQGVGGAFMAGGVGMGAGVGIGAMMANAMAGSNNQNNGNANNAAGGTVCPSCGKTVPAGSKFCPECGKAVSATKFCPECGAKVSAGAKFCPECGKKLG